MTIGYWRVVIKNGLTDMYMDIWTHIRNAERLSKLNSRIVWSITFRIGWPVARKNTTCTRYFHAIHRLKICINQKFKLIDNSKNFLYAERL